MKKRVFIIHGWDGSPQEGWFPWLKKELEKRDFTVQVPKMPNTSEPKMNEWISYLKKLVGKTDKNTYFVGHSIGCQTVLRYFEVLEDKDKVGGAVFVAGWFTLMNLETREERRIAKPWIKTLINFDKIKQHTKKFIAIFSDNDDVVPTENKAMFEERLGSKTILENNKGHFSGSDSIKKLPSALEAVLEIAGEK